VLGKGTRARDVVRWSRAAFMDAPGVKRIPPTGAAGERDGSELWVLAAQFGRRSSRRDCTTAR